MKMQAIFQLKAPCSLRSSAKVLPYHWKCEILVGSQATYINDKKSKSSIITLNDDNKYTWGHGGNIHEITVRIEQVNKPTIKCNITHDREST